MILVIDNYDSFTFNLVQALEVGGARLEVVRNDRLDAAGIEAYVDGERGDEPLRGILVSPGPGDPSSAGVSLDAIAVAARRRVPLLGVCLGHQALAAAFGAAIVRAPSLVHGEASEVRHEGAGVLAGLPVPFAAARYHSLCIDERTLPDAFEVTARTEDGVVMAMRHRELPLEGVQFHPESVLTPHGPRLLANFLASVGEGTAEARERLAGAVAVRGFAGPGTGDDPVASRPPAPAGAAR